MPLRLVLLVIAAALCGACSGPGTEGSGTSEFVAVATAGGTPEKLVVVPGREWSGSVVAPRGGQLDGFSVKLGTYSNLDPAKRSDGRVVIRACVLTECRSASAPLADASDNAPIAVSFDAALPVEAGTRIDFTISSAGSTRPFVVWLYRSAKGSAVITLPGDASKQPRSPRVSLGYSG